MNVGSPWTRMRSPPDSFSGCGNTLGGRWPPPPAHTTRRRSNPAPRPHPARCRRFRTRSGRSGRRPGRTGPATAGWDAAKKLLPVRGAGPLFHQARRLDARQLAHRGCVGHARRGDHGRGGHRPPPPSRCPRSRCRIMLRCGLGVFGSRAESISMQISVRKSTTRASSAVGRASTGCTGFRPKRISCTVCCCMVPDRGRLPPSSELWTTMSLPVNVQFDIFTIPRNGPYRTRRYPLWIKMGGVRAGKPGLMLGGLQRVIPQAWRGFGDPPTKGRLDYDENNQDRTRLRHRDVRHRRRRAIGDHRHHAKQRRRGQLPDDL